MGAWDFAPKVTEVDGPNLPSTISSDPVRIWGIEVHNTSALTAGAAQSTVTVTNADNTKTYLTIPFRGNTTNRVINIPWIADQGIRVAGSGFLGTDVTTHVTVYFSHVGS